MQKFIGFPCFWLFEKQKAAELPVSRNPTAYAMYFYFFPYVISGSQPYRFSNGMKSPSGPHIRSNASSIFALA